MTNDQIAMGSVLSIISELDKRDAEIERLREMLCICLDRWIPFREVDLRRRANEAVGRQPNE